MGSSFEISCSECDYKGKFKIGIGMKYSYYHLKDFDSEFALLPQLISSKKILAHIRKLVEEKNAKIADGYGNEVYRCCKCGEFYGRFFIHLDYDGGSYEIKYKCPVCDENLRRISYNICVFDGFQEKYINVEKYPCPKCGKHSLHDGETVCTLWD